MDGKLKVALQILFMVALIWFLAAVSGFAPGVRVRVGKGSGRGRGGCRRLRRRLGRPFTWTNTGMYGTLVQNPSEAFTPVGVNSTNF